MSTSEETSKFRLMYSGTDVVPLSDAHQEVGVDLVLATTTSRFHDTI